MKKIVVIILLVITFFAGYFFIKKNSIQKISNGKLQVVASFYPMYYFASEIGGDHAQVMNITPASAEPHDYEPTTQDIARIQHADMLVLNGGKLEAWGDKIQEQLQGTKAILVIAGDAFANRNLNENGKNIQDPHVWLDPILAKQEVAAVEKGFEKADPKDTEYFRENATKLNAKLDELDAEFKKGLASCTQKDFVTSHAAFGYLAARYGINQVAISGVSPDEEPSAQKLAETANLVKQKHISVIFFESLISPKLSQTIAQEAGAKTLVLDPIEGISEDDIKAGHTYLTVMRNNLTNLETALQCKK